jgi:hypothetical protein
MLTRPGIWLEPCHAILYSIPIIPSRIKGRGSEHDEAQAFLANLETFVVRREQPQEREWANRHLVAEGDTFQTMQQASSHAEDQASSALDAADADR